MSVPTISIIIPTRNREDLLAACLGALHAQDVPSSDIEVLVSDDSTVPPTETASPILRIAGPRRGPGANRNHAARRARGRWLIFVDDDCQPQGGFLNAYRKAIADADPAQDFFAGATIPAKGGARSLLVESAHNLPPGTFPPPSCNFCISAQLFEEAGGFDERYVVAFEDMEFFSRLAARGARYRFVEEAVVGHPLRPIPGPMGLARRWESRVISCLDHGASNIRILVWLPRHMFAVILSRFRGKSASLQNLRAGFLFAGEFLLVLGMLPGWIVKHRRGPGSAFWRSLPVDCHPPRFGL